MAFYALFAAIDQVEGGLSMELSLNRSAVELLERGEDFAYAVIIAQEGSTPRENGTKMLILPESIVGTIGGGPMEFTVINAGRKMLAEKGTMSVIRYDMSGNTENPDEDCICGGICEVMLVRIAAEDPANLAVFREAARAELEGLPAWLYYILDENEGAKDPFVLAINVDGRVTGDLHGRDAALGHLLESPLLAAVHGEKNDGTRMVSDRVGALNVMYLFGGGHVSLEVARLAVGLGFRVVVFDNLEEFANPARFPGCEVEVLEDFSRIPDLPVGGGTYVLIITRGHANDRVVLQWALDRNPRYIGMIGSRVKRDATYARLESEGYDRAKMEAVHCPIGLSINAKTPAEIAVSVMAEIIQIKNS